MSSLDQTFTSFLKEDNTNSTIPSSGNVLTGLNSEEQEHLLQELNSVLSGITNTPVINPYYIVERIKTRLKLTLGLSFDNTYFLGDVGSFERKLFPHNDLVSVEGGNIPPNDNAWLKLFPHGLCVRIRFVKVSNLYTVSAEILPVKDFGAPPSISEN
jgi:hypothetical protein